MIKIHNNDLIESIDDKFYNFVLKNESKIILYTSSENENLGYKIFITLKQLNLNIPIILSNNTNINNLIIDKNDLFIILDEKILLLNKYIENYIIFNLIKFNNLYDLSDEYMKILLKSKLILEPYLDNIEKYSTDLIKKVNFQPILFYKELLNNIEIKYDILFIGFDIDIDIDVNFIKKIKKFYIRIEKKINSKTQEYIHKSKIIVFSKKLVNPNNMIIKLNELIEFNKIIITDIDLLDNFYKEIYDGIIYFIKDIQNNIDTIINIVNNNFILNYKLNKLSKFFIKKNLLSIKNLFTDYKVEYYLEKDYIYCLSLLETPFRKNGFYNQNYYPKVKMFPGIKYNPGWLGCALSYYNLILNAKNNNLERITICEDDCKFNSDFDDKFKIINEYLDLNKNWDIFVGCIAFLPGNTNIKIITDYKNVKFIEIDQFHSTVFNIYNKSSYDTILMWSMENKDLDTNQIDQFMKRSKLKIITTFPFEFSCINNLKSTLWEHENNNLYNNSFKQSLNILQNKINNFYKYI